jgi:hypothetical protein
LTFPVKSIKYKLIPNLRAVFLSPTLTLPSPYWGGGGVKGRWRSADRAWLETAIPPVFGKEMEQRSQMADIPNTDISHFVLRGSDERIL